MMRAVAFFCRVCVYHPGAVVLASTGFNLVNLR